MSLCWNLNLKTCFNYISKTCIHLATPLPWSNIHPKQDSLNDPVFIWVQKFLDTCSLQYYYFSSEKEIYAYIVRFRSHHWQYVQPWPNILSLLHRYTDKFVGKTSQKSMHMDNILKSINTEPDHNIKAVWF